MAVTKNKPRRRRGVDTSGKLRIGDDWNAIRIIALSQTNPLKAVAEFVENSIDAGASRITISRFRQKGEVYLRIDDNGGGVPLDSNGQPNFRYVATHICDSIKRQMKAQGLTGVQGEFGIGLLSFWTVGKTLSMVCCGSNGKPYEMRMEKGSPDFSVSSRRLVSESGTRLTVGPLLSGIRGISGEKLQWFLASELRDRIQKAQVDIQIIDRLTRKEYAVQPSEFEGQQLYHLPSPKSPYGNIYVEICLAEPKPDRAPSLYRSGTRVLPQITQLESFQKSPWDSGYFSGVIDVPFLNLTPGTRLGVIQDEKLQSLTEALNELEAVLNQTIKQQQQIESEKANRDTLQSIRKAFREALLILPEEEYDWFDILNLDGPKSVRRLSRRPAVQYAADGSEVNGNGLAGEIREPMFVDKGLRTGDHQEADQMDADNGQSGQKSFYEHAGPLYSARISPTTCTMSVGATKNFQAIARDRNRRTVIDELEYQWVVSEGTAALVSDNKAIVTLTAPLEPQLLRLSLTVTQRDRRLVQPPSTNVELASSSESLVSDPDSEHVRSVQAEAIITVTDSLLPKPSQAEPQRGMPQYTYEKQPGQLWRSRFDIQANLIVINSGHRDFVYASRNKSLKLRYICRLFGKELVLQNFPGMSSEQLLERLIELALSTEENLR